MTIFFVNKYKNAHHYIGLNEVEAGVAGFLLFGCKIFHSYKWTASVIVCQKNRLSTHFSQKYCNRHFIKNLNSMTFQRLFAKCSFSMTFPGLDFIFSFSMVFHDRGNPGCFSVSKEDNLVKLPINLILNLYN